jgi:predicted PurR-regulated permease PerM
MIEFLVNLLIGAIIFYCIYLVINWLIKVEPIKTIAYCIMGILVLLWILGMFGIYNSPVYFHLHD